VSNLHQLEREIYEARDSSGMGALKEYARTKAQSLSDRLLSCDLEQVRALQGEAKAYNDLIMVLEKEPFDLN